MALSASISAHTAIQQEITRLAGLRDVHLAMEWVRSHEPELCNQQLEVAAIPAPPFGERARGEWLRSRFLQLGLQDVGVDSIGNVVGVGPGSNAAEKLV